MTLEHAIALAWLTARASAAIALLAAGAGALLAWWLGPLEGIDDAAQHDG